jgi:uncharacterized protein YbjT (DUF2867 family)
VPPAGRERAGWRAATAVTISRHVLTRRSILLAGATGLVGRECLRLLVGDPAFSRVVVLARRPLPESASAPKLEAHVVDFDGLEANAALFKVDQILCALGTTIKQAGSRARFRAVDHDYPIALARLGLQHGARHFLLVSALGANPRSRIFYNRVKGEVEEAVLALPYRSVTIARPSLLLGERRDRRLGEEIGKRVAFLVPSKYKPVQAQAVAAALVRLAREDAPGRRVIESEEIRTGGGRRQP